MVQLLTNCAGRALGEVTKYLVYNARKRGEDRASDYFKRTENVAGVKDMRFQALMPDILHWLGITKIDRMLSMSKCVYITHVPRAPYSLWSLKSNSTTYIKQHEARCHCWAGVSSDVTYACCTTNMAS